MKRLFSVFFFFTIWSLNAQNYNLNLLGTLDYNDDCSDIWGYTDSQGTEYAIMGVFDGTAIISLADPTNPTEIEYIQGGGSTWRDMKTWNDYAYITTEAEDGVLIVDMSDAHNGNVSHSFYKPQLNIPNSNGTLSTIHNLYIDEGYMYLAGANLNNGGVLIFDLNANPTMPPLVGVCEPIYSHDVYVRDNIVWSSNVNNGHFSAIDVSDKANPVTLSYTTTSFDFSHNAWLSDNGQYIFTTDELPNANIDAYDVSDVNNIVRLDTWHPSDTEGTGVIPHNVHVKDDYLVISYYTDGIKIVDAHRPTNLVEVGSYDTFTGQGQGFQGCWGAYPFFESGKVLASDINSGLFVFDITYQRACYLEGTVTDANNQAPLNNVSIEILSSHNITDASKSNGEYATGQVTPGTFDVVYSKPGYVSQTVSVSLVNGQVTIQDVALETLPSTSLQGKVTVTSGGNALENAVIRVGNNDFSFDAMTDNNGDFTIDNIFEGAYTVYVGKWGYSTEEAQINVAVGSSNTIDVELEEGYQDPFAVDLGWDVISGAESGNWELGEPVGTSYGSFYLNPDFDSDLDVGDWCYVTGNGGGNAGSDDVDDGSTTLTSPKFDLTTYTDPYLVFQPWFVNGGGNDEPNDQLEFFISNGNNNQVNILTISETNEGWFDEIAIKVSDFMTPGSNMTFIARTSDLQDSGHLVEAALDNFRVTDGNPNPVSVDNLEETIGMDVLPNPFSNTLSIHFHEGRESGSLQIFDLAGKLIMSQEINNENTIDVATQSWSKGVYTLQYTSEGRRIIRKVIKQ